MAPRRRCAVVRGTDAEGLDAILAQHRHQLREAALLQDVVHGQRLLGFPHQSPGRLIHGQFPDPG